MLVEAKRGGTHDALLHFVNTESGKWFEKGFTKKMISWIQDIATFGSLNYFEVIMLAILPSLTVDRNLSLRCKMEAREWLFSYKTGWEKPSKGDTIIRHPIFRKWAEMLYAHFDLALDGEQGETSNMLRLQHFATWYPRGPDQGLNYLRELERMLKDST